MRLTAIVDLNIKSFAGGIITLFSSGSKNIVYDKYPDSGNWYATQRPGINVLESPIGPDVNGRGVYYWNRVGTKYLVNNGTVYQSSYGGPQMAISSGADHVSIFEIGNYLVIIDQENNEGWTIDSSTSTVISQIVDPNFPPNQGFTLARGGAVLNQKLYVITTDGDIYESNIQDPTTWGVLDFINAEVSPDDGVYLGEHHQHIVAIGAQSLEFFYDAKNPTGSTLAARTDIDFSIGAVQESSFWEESDLIFWVGFTSSGGVGVYSLQNMVPNKISSPSIDSFIGSAITVDKIRLMGSGFQVGGRIYYVLTLYNLLGDIQPLTTLVYELTSDRWYVWDVEQPGVEGFPLVSWTKASSTRLGEGILSDGSLVNPLDDNNPQDTVGSSTVFESDVFEVDVFTATSASGNAIQIEIVTGPSDFGNRKTKFQTELWLVATPTKSANTLTVETSDEADDNWGPPRNMDTSNGHSELTRLGKFRQRNYRIKYQANEQYRLEGIETVEKQGVQ